MSNCSEKEGAQQLLVDGAPTVTEDHRHLGEVAGAAVAAEVGEDVIVDNLVTVIVTLPPIADHSDTVAENITVHDTLFNESVKLEPSSFNFVSVVTATDDC